MKRLRNVKNADDAIVGIVASFLIVGLIVVVVSVIQTVYIPEWMEQQEAEHMEEVGNQFAQLKYAIGEHMLMKQKGVPISTSITLGSKELPFLMSSRAFGSLTILSDQCTITIDNDTNSFSFPLGIIKYSSANAYYLNQDYIYEAGAVILYQNQGNTMVVKPNFLVSNEDEVNINFTITNISTIARKNSISGYGTYPIQTEFSDNNSIIIQDISDIIIDTNYQNAWHRFINGILQNQGFTNYNVRFNESEIIVEFFGAKTVNIEIKYIQIDAQVAPGWIENIKG
jgi:hypothetical protein